MSMFSATWKRRLLFGSAIECGQRRADPEPGPSRVWCAERRLMVIRPGLADGLSRLGLHRSVESALVKMSRFQDRTIKGSSRLDQRRIKIGSLPLPKTIGRRVLGQFVSVRSRLAELGSEAGVF